MNKLGTVKQVINVDYHELDEFISRYFGVEFEFVPNHEASNDSSYEFKVGKIQDYEREYVLEVIESLKKGIVRGFSTSQILNYLADQGVIAEGDYIISVCW